MSGRLLVVDDEPRYRALYADVLSAAGFEVIEADSAAAGLRRIAASQPDMVISDVRMPGGSGLELLDLARRDAPELPFLLVTAYADVRDAVIALKHGAVDYLAKPVDLDELVACVQDTLGFEATNGQAGEPPAEALGPMVAESDPMRALLRDAWRIAKSDVNVLIAGESGTGKEVMARFLHRNNPRADRPFVAVNCAALPSSLFASELFGHERGAFTGATAARKGLAREADSGVLFLDEIGAMPLDQQPVLLRTLEQRTVSPMGASGEKPVDFRLIAATNANLEASVAAGEFRADLYYRLNVITLQIPPLRERVQDILPLARRFLSDAGGHDKRIARATARCLRGHTWPGNVRELQNAMQRARLLSATNVILPESLPPAIQRETPEIQTEVRDPNAVQTLQASEIENVQRALTATGGNRTKAAELLGITRRGLLKKLKRYGLQPD